MPPPLAKSELNLKMNKNIDKSFSGQTLTDKTFFCKNLKFKKNEGGVSSQQISPFQSTQKTALGPVL
jgi:hypothetical protein